MAKRKPMGSDNRKTMEHHSFRVDDSTPGDPIWYRAVCDEIAHDKLDDISNAIGGTDDTATTIYNSNVITVNTEQSQVLPANTKGFIIRSRNKGQLRLAFALGGTSTTYLTIPRGTSYEDTRFRTAATLYFQSDKPGDVVEIVAYS